MPAFTYLTQQMVEVLGRTERLEKVGGRQYRD